MHELGGPPAVIGEAVDEAGLGDVALADGLDGDEVLALQVADQGVIRVEASRRPLQRVAAELESIGEVGLGRRRHPGVTVLGHVMADGVGHLALRVPDSGAHEALPGLEVQVEAGGVGVVPALVAEVHAGVGLVGRLVAAEPGVALDAEQRAAHRAGIGHEVGRDRVEAFREVGDEVECRLAHRRLVSGLVGVEPLAIVVRGKVLQEGEQRRGEMLRRHQSTSPRSPSTATGSRQSICGRSPHNRSSS